MGKNVNSGSQGLPHSELRIPHSELLPIPHSELRIPHSEMVLFDISDGVLLDLSEAVHPVLVRVQAREPLRLEGGSTHFGVVVEGKVTVELPAAGTFSLRRGMYFVLPGQGMVRGDAGRVLVVSHAGYRGLAQFGGPLEAEGRLRYIDGCTDTLLVSPPRLGEPCLNHLHVPPGTRQTAHTHPSVRIGAVLSGEGECRTEAGVTRLTTGAGWYIPAGLVHAFVTHGEALDVVAWHPDSDFGPTDTDHPMLNRTVTQKGSVSL